MINIIETAVITIIISFASGLLLDYFTNLAPRILCNVRDGIPLELNSQKIWAYMVTVNNTSNRTIHELTLNIQSLQSSLKSTDAAITKGLKFDSSINDNVLDVYIPFLSKGDEFSVTVYVENQYATHDKPTIIIRSPENFKEIDSVKRKGVLSLLFDIPKNINQLMLKQMGKKKAIYPSKNKKAMIIIVSTIILVMVAGVLGRSYLKGASTNAQTPAIKTVAPKQSTRKATDTTGSKIGNTESTGTKGSADGTTETTGVKGSTGTTANTTAKDSTTGTTDTTGVKSGTTETPSTTQGTTSTPGATSGTTNTSGTTSGTTVAPKTTVK